MFEDFIIGIGSGADVKVDGLKTCRQILRNIRNWSIKVKKWH
jgi:hypothetical protein